MLVTRGRNAAAFPEAVGFPRPGHARIVVVPERRCFAIDGTGEPGGRDFKEAIGALYGTAYRLHFMLRDRGVEAHVPPVEALWFRKDGEQDWSDGEVAFDPAAWRWTLLMPIPGEAEDEDIEIALRPAHRQGGDEPVLRPERRTIAEGLVVEAMHLGPYATEPKTIAMMRGTAAAAGLAPFGAHHEIYLNDPQRTRAENLRTVLRQAVR